MPESQATPRPRRLTSKRLVGACKGCHDRKVRCDLARSGLPCTNCSLDDVQCEPRTRKSRKVVVERIEPRRTNSSSTHEPTNESTAQSLPGSVSTAQDGGEVSPEAAEQLDSNNSPAVLIGHGARSPQPAPSTESAEGSSIQRSVFGSHISHYEETPPESSTNVSKETPLYADPRGLALVLEICETGNQDRSGHILVPDGKANSLAPEDLDYLRLKGVFSLPEKAVCDQLIRTYCHYVHPFFPILELKSFLSAYENAEIDKFGIHLLWSIFLVASHFSEEHLIQRAGFSSRKEMRRSLYAKSKVLYDMQYERDRITLIQCVLLMGFWYCDTEDRTGPWHWTGVAISLCQTAGLHRQPDSRTRSRAQGRHLLWRHIWWACVHRDALYSAGLGRPMRINLDDCDIELPDPSDYSALLAGIPQGIQEKYLPGFTREFSQLWVELLRLTAILAQVLSTHYRVKPVSRTSTAADLEIESQIAASHDILDPIKKTSYDTVYYHVCHLELFAQSILIILYRPYLLDSSPRTQSSPSQGWRSGVRRKAQAAATGFNQVLSALIAADMIKYCQSIVCVALVPPMQVHLLNSTSNQPLLHSMGNNNLELCMMVVKEIRKTWFGAEIVYRMFRQAQLLIEKRTSRQNQENIEAGEAESMTAGLSSDTEAADEGDPLLGFGYPYLGLEGFLNGDDFAMIGAGFDFNAMLPTNTNVEDSAGAG